MKTGRVIFLSLLFAVIGTSASFAGVDTSTVELGHYALCETLAPAQVKAAEPATMKSCDQQADCVDKIASKSA